MSISKEIAGQTKVVSLARPQSLSLNTLKPILPALLLAALVIIFQTLPNAQPLEDTAKFLFLALVTSGLYLAWWIASYFIQSQQEKLYHVLPKLIAGLVLLNLWELLTLKFNVFPLPYFPSASKVVSVLFSDWKLLGISTLYSLRLLALGYGIGVLAGIPTGIAMGWYIQWAQGWAEYAKVYASLLVMALLFSSIITLVFRLRDRILVWQKGLIKW